MLILDNAPSHPAANLLQTEDEKIFLKYLPANITALIQPMDQDVIAALKKTYGNNLLQTYVDKKLDFKGFKAISNILTAIIEVSTVWPNIKTETFRNSWRKLFSSDPDLEVRCSSLLLEVKKNKKRKKNNILLQMTTNSDN